MPPGTRLLGKDIEAPDVVRAANLGGLKDLANDWRVPVIAVAAVEKTALVRPGPVHLEDVLGPEVSNYTPDCAIVLNRDTVTAASSGNGNGREQTIRVSVEKNRHGPSELEWRHELLGGLVLYSQPGAGGSGGREFSGRSGEMLGLAVSQALNAYVTGNIYSHLLTLPDWPRKPD
jgi:hypothetical protein